jgi:hypothetical protein
MESMKSRLILKSRVEKHMKNSKTNLLKVEFAETAPGSHSNYKIIQEVLINCNIIQIIYYQLSTMKLEIHP